MHSSSATSVFGHRVSVLHDGRVDHEFVLWCACSGIAGITGLADQLCEDGIYDGCVPGFGLGMVVGCDI